MPACGGGQLESAVPLVELDGRIPAQRLEIDAPATGLAGESLHVLEQLRANVTAAALGPHVEVFHVERATVGNAEALVVAQGIADVVAVVVVGIGATVRIMLRVWRAMRSIKCAFELNLV